MRRGKKRAAGREEEEEEEYGRAALPVGRGDAAGALDGLRYLALVRAERESPRFLVTLAPLLHPSKHLQDQAPPRPDEETRLRDEDEETRLRDEDVRLRVDETRRNEVRRADDAWTVAFQKLFGKIREEEFAKVGPGEDQLAVLRQRFRGVSEELCRDLFCFAARLPAPLSDGAAADLRFFERKLEVIEDNDAAFVALEAIKTRLSK